MKHRAKIKSLVRHILTFGGGIAVSYGLVDEGTASIWQSPEFVGGVVSIIGLVWGVFDPDKKIGRGDPE